MACRWGIGWWRVWSSKKREAVLIEPYSFPDDYLGWDRATFRCVWQVDGTLLNPVQSCRLATVYRWIDDHIGPAEIFYLGRDSEFRQAVAAGHVHMLSKSERR